MKITTLLTQYLYTNHRLDLTGIGSFLLDASSVSEMENSKQRSMIPTGITFTTNTSLKESPELIAYISAQSGKIKALASADLASHLELAQQFLNIGKPFTFDGIGTLAKLRAGDFEFIPISVSPDKVRGLTTKEPVKSNKREESFLDTPPVKRAFSKPFVAALVVAGLALAIWGGYTISKKPTPGADTVAAVVQPDAAVPVLDTAKEIVPQTAVAIQPSNVGSSYKYILEVSQSKRAFKRFNQLKTNQWDVKLETKDSVQYKLYLLLPAIASDSTRVMDSLTAMTGRRVYIEHQN